MKIADKGETFRVDSVSAVLGVPMLEIDQDQRAATANAPFPIQLETIGEQMIIVRLGEILTEIQGLRADLAARTFGARWQRFLVWCRRLVGADR